MSDSEKSFSEGETSEDDAESVVGSGTEEDEDDQDERPARPRSVQQRLAQTSAYRVDVTRTREWLLKRVDEARSKVDALADLQSLPQPASLNCTMHPYQLRGMRWALALQRCGLSGILADESKHPTV